MLQLGPDPALSPGPAPATGAGLSVALLVDGGSVLPVASAAAEALVRDLLQAAPRSPADLGSEMAKAGHARPAGCRTWGTFLRRRPDLCRMIGNGNDLRAHPLP